MDTNIAEILAIATRNNIKVSIFDKETVEKITCKKLSYEEWQVIQIDFDNLNWFDINEQICEMVNKVKEG